MKGYQLTKAFYSEFAENEAMQIGCTANHHSLYTWICELRNQIQTRHPGREIMDLPARYTMEMAFIGSDHTLKKCIDQLAHWGIIEIVSRMKGHVTKVKLSVAYMRKHEQRLNSNPELSQICDYDANAVRLPCDTSNGNTSKLSHICDCDANAMRLPCDSGANSNPELSQICDYDADNKNNIKQTIYNGVVPEKKSEDQSLDDTPPEAIIDTAVKTNRAGQMIKPDLPTITAFVLDKGGTPAMAEAIFDFYTMKGWKVGKDAMKDWNAAARKWIRENMPKQTDQTTTRPKKLVV